jgi:hypothetical protein
LPSVLLLWLPGYPSSIPKAAVFRKQLLTAQNRHKPIPCPFATAQATGDFLMLQLKKDRVLVYPTALALCLVTLLVVYSNSAAQPRSEVQLGIQLTATGSSHRRMGPAGQQQQPCTVKTKYMSSAFEQSWLDNVASWQNTFCEAVKTPQQQAWTKVWLDSTREENAGKQVAYDPEVFSRFVTTTTCPGQPPQDITTWIEPLAHGLRHPHSLCNMGTDVMDRGYLLLTNQADMQALHAAAQPSGLQACQNRTCQAIYMDLGATRWEAAPTSVGQGWFVR